MAEVGKHPNTYQNIKDINMKKKIDIDNSIIYSSTNMEDLPEAIPYIEHNGYFSNDEDFSEYRYGELTQVHASYKRDFAFFGVGLNFETYFKYFAPESEIVFEKERKVTVLRPFKDIEEFFEETGLELGKSIRCRKKDNIDKECVAIITGYNSDGHILLGGGVYYKFKDLFDKYEYYDIYNLFWKPFGVEEE